MFPEEPKRSDGGVQRSHFPPGSILGGRYEVVRCLGESARSAVFLCEDLLLDRKPFGVKVLWLPKKLLDEDDTLLQRFKNEAAICHRIRHPNVVASYEYFSGENFFAYSMDYISGGSLADLMESKKPLSMVDIMHILSQACCGVFAIHSAGIIHRDIKPDNILVSTNGEIKVADLGVARLDDGRKLTAQGAILGTMEYCSPEYLMHGSLDMRSDIYALGLLGYELITGTKPYQGATLLATLRERLTKDPVPPDQRAPTCPPELSAVIMRAMRRDPSERFQSAGEMFESLRTILEARVQSTSQVLRRPAAAGALVGSGPRSSPSGRRASAPRRGGDALVSFLRILLIVVVLALGGYALLMYLYPFPR